MTCSKVFEKMKTEKVLFCFCILFYYYVLLSAITEAKPQFRFQPPHAHTSLHLHLPHKTSSIEVASPTIKKTEKAEKPHTHTHATSYSSSYNPPQGV
jgi:hypothetical protein